MATKPVKTTASDEYDNLIEQAKSHLANNQLTCNVNAANAAKVVSICKRVEHRELKAIMAQEQLDAISSE